MQLWPQLADRTGDGQFAKIIEVNTFEVIHVIPTQQTNFGMDREKQVQQVGKVAGLYP